MIQWWYLCIISKAVSYNKSATNRFLFHNSLSCLVSHPDETLRKRLKEKRKGGFYCLCLLLHFTTAPVSIPVCMNEHEPSKLGLSIITHRSAKTNHRAPHNQLLSTFKDCQAETNQGHPKAVFLERQQEMSALCLQQEWGMNCVVCHDNHSGCSLILPPHVLQQ